ncbi:hypothetical protein KR032_005769 [Drosophila birchii]|nr:hypothetical protein KR032_005769 [Drosophila birchii]
MAATPPMPPGSNTQHHVSHVNGIVKQSNGQGNHLTEAINQHFQRKNQQNQKHNCAISPNPNQYPNPNSPGGSRCGSNEQLELLEPQHTQEAAAAAAGKAKLSCHCTNISIMHLFHEMKQEFPTIPDAIVTQCVNENCHQRENCIQMLRKELALHPIPVQSYPAKVLQQQQQQQQQQIRPAKPPTPLKPSRAAPPQPDFSQSNGSPSSPANIQPRPRPTTLNLQRQVNTQLQQKIQQRQQRQQRDQQPQQLTPTSLSKPLRRAPPLPPPPKPNPNPKPGSFSNDSSCLTSPMSSSESELSLNAAGFLSSPTTATGAAIAVAQPQPQQPSPVRHRSVITLQPEPPYARDFLTSSSNSSSSGGGVTTTTSPPTIATPPLPSPSSAASPVAAAGGRKSFTSLNLTLRQPTTGPAQSAIDITAGPAPSGQGSGITYSSVSFDARRGTHKNFQLTVTEEGSVFSAGCIRPRVPYTGVGCDPATNQQPQPPAPPPTATSSAVLASDGHGEEMQMDVFPYPTQAQNHIVASNYSNNQVVTDNNNGNGSSSVDSSPTMPLYVGVLEECDREAHAATIERQKQRRAKLANALRDNKKRLLVLEQEINILTEPVPVGESERLDRDIKQLAEDCQQLNQLLNRINEPQANDSSSGSATNSMNRQNSAPASQQQQQPPPRQRPGSRVQAPPNSLRLHSVPAVPTTGLPIPDFGQHQQHSSAPSSACLTPQHQLQQEPPPTYAQYYQFQQYLHQQRQQQLQQLQVQQQQQEILQQQQQRAVTEEEEFQSDSDAEAEETLDSWACNMCTFRNHPQLNICEACDYVRIQPGMLHFVPNATAAAAAAAAAAGGGGTGDQQQQPPQQPYALHT